MGQLLLRTIPPLFFLFCSAMAVVAQPYYYDMWYFGNRQAMTFRSGTASPLSGSLETLEGCASMCDPATGAILFYTNGATVWNGAHNPMPNGTNLFGNLSCTQSSLIVPHPGNSSLYYLFTLDGTTSGGPRGPQGLGLRYSVVDMRQGNGMGDVVTKNISLLPGASEKITAVRHSNGCDYWVITHELRNDKFYAWLITRNGLFPYPIISSVGSEYNATEAGYLKASPDGTLLFAARSFINYNGNYGELIRFDPATGVVGPLLEAIPSGYGAGFSPDNNFLYASRQDSLFQYDLQETPGRIASTAVLLNNPNAERMLYGMQLTRDGELYVVEGPVFTTFTLVTMALAAVGSPNTRGIGANYRHVFNYPNVSFFAGLPNCIDGYLGESSVGGAIEGERTLDATDTVICAGESVQLTAQGGSWYRWDSADGLDCYTCNDPIVRPQKTTTYKVWIHDGRSCPSLDSLMVTIYVEPSTIDAGNDTTICLGSSVRLHAVGGSDYVWSPAADLSCIGCADPVATPQKTTTYYVLGLSPGRCRDIDSVVVTVNARSAARIEQKDTALKCGQQVQLKASGGMTYRWSPAESLSCVDCPDPIAAPIQTTTYYLESIDSLGCSGLDSVTVRVSGADISATADTIIGCGETARLKGSGGVEYHWSPAEGLSCTDCPDPVASPKQTTTYYLVGVNALGCSGADSVIVTVQENEVSAGKDTSLCAGQTIRLHASGRREYLWSPADGLSCADCPNPLISPMQTTTYVVQGTTNGQCLSFDTVVVTVRPAPKADAGSDTTLCLGDSIRLHATGEGNLYWTPGVWISCLYCADPVVFPRQSQTYYLQVTNEKGCVGWDSIRITVQSSGLVEAGSDRSICAGESAGLSASGAEAYQWSPAEGLSCTDCANPTARPRETTTYYVIGTVGSETCAGIDSVRVEVHPLPDVDAGADTAVCTGEEVKLHAQGGTSYQWDASPDLSCLDCSDPIARPSGTTMYYVTGRNGFGCASRDSVRVVVHPGLTVSAGGDRSLCGGESVELSATGGERWLWEPSEGLSCTDCPGPTASPSGTTEYRLTAWSAEGCVAHDTVMVFVREEQEIIRLRIGRDYHGGSDKDLEIGVEIIDSIKATDITELEFRLEYDPGTMRIDAESVARLLDGTVLSGWNVAIREIGAGGFTVRLTAPAGTTLRGKGIFLRLTGRLYLSNVRGAELPFTVETGSRCFAFATEPGYAEVDSICGLNLRLIELTGAKYVAPTTWPNPARDRVRFEFGLGLDGPTRLEVYDPLGNRLGVLVSDVLSPGRYNLEWNVRDVPSGVYWYRLTSGDWSSGGEVRVEH